MRCGGFTLIEVLAVVLILAILFALAAGGFSGFRSRAELAGCAGHLRDTYAAMMSYAADHNGKIPITQDAQDSNKAWFTYLMDGGYITSTPSPDKRFTSKPGQFTLFCPGAKVKTDRMVCLNFGNYGLNSDVAGLVMVSGSDVTVTPTKPMGSIGRPARTILMLDAGYYQIRSRVLTRPQSPLHYIPGYPLNQTVSWAEDRAEDALEGRHGGKVNVLMADGHVETWLPADFVDSSDYWTGVE